MNVNVCVCVCVQGVSVACHSMDLCIGWSWWAGSETRWALWALVPLPPTDSYHCDTPAPVHEWIRTWGKYLWLCAVSVSWNRFVPGLHRWSRQVNSLHPGCRSCLSSPLLQRWNQRTQMTLDLSTHTSPGKNYRPVQEKDTAWLCYIEK